MKYYIPKIIHLTFLNKKEPLPGTFEHCIANIKNKCRGWDIRIYNEDDATLILKNHIPQLLEYYNSFKLNVQKSDFLRIVLVYLFGGFYMDMDIWCIKNLNELREFEVVLAEEKIISEKEREQLNLKYRSRIANYMFGSKPGHLFWIYVLKQMININMVSKSESDVLEYTGPGLITNTYLDNRMRFPEILLLRNIDRKCIRPFHNDIACHFGNFASHLHTGTWRGFSSNKSTKRTLSKKTINCMSEFLDSLIPTAINYGPIYIQKASSIDDLYNLNDIYNNLRIFCNDTDNSSFLKGRIVIVFDMFLEIEFAKISNENFNILIVPTPQKLLSKKIVRLTNTYYSLCIVPDRFAESALLAEGIDIPIKVIDFGFKRFKRFFDHSSAGINTDFNIGVFVSSLTPVSLRKISQIVEYCRKVRHSAIFELNLHIYHSDSPELIIKTLNSKNDSINWVKFQNSEPDLWLDKLDCFLSIDSESHLGFGLMAPLYLGIPVINILECKMKAGSNLENNMLADGIIIVEETDRLPLTINHLYENYSSYNKKAIRVAKKLEDKFLIEGFCIKIMNLIREILCQNSISIQTE